MHGLYSDSHCCSGAHVCEHQTAKQMLPLDHGAQYNQLYPFGIWEKYSMFHKSWHYRGFTVPLPGPTLSIFIFNFLLSSQRPDGLSLTTCYSTEPETETASVEASAWPSRTGIKWSRWHPGFPLQCHGPQAVAAMLAPHLRTWISSAHMGTLVGAEGPRSLHTCRSTCQRWACSQQIFSSLLP